MPTGRQIQAARMLLEWTAADLAKKSDLALSTIGLSEQGDELPPGKARTHILEALDKQGIEFTSGEGVRFREIETRTFTGKDAYRQMLDHIHKVMSENKGGRLYQIASDAKYLAYAGDYAETYIEKMAAIPDLDSRALTIMGDNYFPASYCEYRLLPKEFSKLSPFCVYGDYVVFPVQETARQMALVSIHSKLLADRQVEQFKIFWNLALKLTLKKSKAKN